MQNIFSKCTFNTWSPHSKENPQLIKRLCLSQTNRTPWIRLVSLRRDRQPHLCKLRGPRTLPGPRHLDLKRNQPPRERTGLSPGPSSSTGLVFPNYAHTLNLLHKFLLRGEVGGHVTYSKLAGFRLMSSHCLPGRCGDEKQRARKKQDLVALPRTQNCGFTRSISAPGASA